MSTSPARALARGFMASAVLALALPACDSAPPADKKQPAAPAYDLSEKPAWTAPTNGKRYCPQYINGTVIDAGASDVTVRDAATGKTKWTHKGSDMSCPIVTPQAVYIAHGAGNISALDPSTGQVKSSIDTDGLSGKNPPYVTPSGVHVEFGGDVYSVDRALKGQIWKYEEKADMRITETEVSGSTVLMATQNGKVKARSGKDGGPLWTYTTPSYGEIPGDMTVSDKIVSFASQDGSVYALDLATGKKIWATKLDQGPAWRPHPAAGLLITADEKYIHALDRQTGEKKWRHAADRWMVTTAAGQAIYSDSKAGKVTSLDAATGKNIDVIPNTPGATWLTTSPTHLYIWTDNGIQAHKFTKRTVD
ncbi:PQQ-binding-like beta-propeller repeat protein [Streptomyces wuyuanensis]|uniref:PQQ-binding-like beta-propeller repeat protein n=1 Tax=Streptomyces wuyuanensis TaxID=1196353 RepID=UPI00381CA55E